MSEKEIDSIKDEGELIPNSNTVLILGIISIPTCFCFGIPGILIAALAFSFHKKAIKLYNTDPSRYQKTSFNNLKTGKICAQVGIILALIYILFVILLLISGAFKTIQNFTIL